MAPKYNGVIHVLSWVLFLLALFGVVNPTWVTLDHGGVHCSCNPADSVDCCAFEESTSKSTVGVFYGFGSLMGSCVTPKGHRIFHEFDDEVCYVSDYEKENHHCFSHNRTTTELFISSGVIMILAALTFIVCIIMSGNPTKHDETMHRRSLFFSIGTTLFLMAVVLIPVYVALVDARSAHLEWGWAASTVPGASLALAGTVITFASRRTA